MVTFKPLRALRYANDIDLALVTAPPYDVIPPAEQRVLESRDAHNIVHLTLGSERPNDSYSSNKYTRAASFLRDWIDSAVLIEDPEENFFLYRVDFELGGRPQSSAGVIGLLELEPFGDSVLPHEKTMPGPKADRLELLRATEANLEPLWFIASEATGLMAQLVKETEDSAPLAEVVDSDRVIHRVWPVDGTDFAGALSHQPIVVADGHHRYETAVAYRDERKTEEGERPWDYTLALIQDPVEFGPRLLPIHRVVAGTSISALREVVELETFKGPLDDLIRIQLSSGGGQVGIASGDGMLWMKTAGLDTEYLKDRVLEPLGLEPTYEHDASVLADHISKGSTAFVMAPVPIDAVIETASAGKRMPPKTTLFWPKPRSGLIMRRMRLI